VTGFCAAATLFSWLWPQQPLTKLMAPANKANKLQRHFIIPAIVIRTLEFSSSKMRGY